MKLADLKIIVTGAASGMGKHFATRLAEAGAEVAAGDINEAGLDDLPGSVRRRALDVREPDQCEDFCGWAADALGGLNALINNAGILQDGMLVKQDKKTGQVKKLSDAQWHAVINTNLHGATYMAREAVARMVALGSRPGVVVSMSSSARHGNFGQSNYAAAKAALAANTFTWAREWARFGIRACAVAPGMIDTPMTQGMPEAALAALIERIPVGRVGLPEDIWLAVRFCLECDFFNGRTMDVDGGLTM